MALGALTSLLPREVLDGAIGKYGCREQRVRKLPAHVVVQSNSWAHNSFHREMQSVELAEMYAGVRHVSVGSQTHTTAV